MSKKRPVEVFTRTEGSYVYQYGKRIASSYGTWCAKRRQLEATHHFFDFYNIIKEEERQTITVKKITNEKA